MRLGKDRVQPQDSAWEECWCVGADGDKLLLGLRVKRLMGLMKGNVANARCWETTPLSLEREGRT